MPPAIIQCDNRREFKGALLLILRRHGIQLINSKPRSPQTNGLIEQGNGVVEYKIRAWKSDHGTHLWHNGLLEVVLAINQQVHLSTGLAL